MKLAICIPLMSAFRDHRGGNDSVNGKNPVNESTLDFIERKSYSLKPDRACPILLLEILVESSHSSTSRRILRGFFLLVNRLDPMENG